MTECIEISANFFLYNDEKWGKCKFKPKQIDANYELENYLNMCSIPSLDRDGASFNLIYINAVATE